MLDANPKPIPDLSEAQLRNVIEEPPGIRFAVFFYTPMCGTCKLADRMLHIAAEAGDTIPTFRMNVNFAPWFVRKWEIRSIPCLVVFERGAPKRFRYAMESVQDIFETLK